MWHYSMEELYKKTHLIVFLKVSTEIFETNKTLVQCLKTNIEIVDYFLCAEALQVVNVYVCQGRR